MWTVNLSHGSWLIMSVVFAVACTGVDESIPAPNELDRWEYFPGRKGPVLALYEDSDSHLWIGTPHGVSKYDGSGFEDFTSQDGLVNDTVLTIIQDFEGDLWFGTPGGISILVENGFINISTLAGFDANVSSLLEDEDDNVWIGTSNLGVWFAGPGGLESFFDDHCLECNIINTLFEDSRGQVWVGSQADLKRYRNRGLRSFTVQDGLAGSNVTSVYEDSNGVLWVGTFDDDEITQFEDGDFDQVSLSNGADQNWITAITQDRQERLWIGVAQNGVILYDGLVSRTLFEGPPPGIILSMITDQQGDIWVGTASGLAKYISK